MKMKTYLCAAMTVALCGSGMAVASHQPGHPSVRQARSGGEPTMAEQTDTDKLDESSTTWRVVRYPGRFGSTVVRSPLIMGETVTGKRTFISKKGFFQTREEIPAQESARQGRGQRPTSER